MRYAATRRRMLRFLRSSPHVSAEKMLGEPAFALRRADEPHPDVSDGGGAAERDDGAHRSSRGGDDDDDVDDAYISRDRSGWPMSAPLLEERALLLARVGHHARALSIYVHSLPDKSRGMRLAAAGELHWQLVVVRQVRGSSDRTQRIRGAAVTTQ